jgi:hypothetical protein
MVSPGYGANINVAPTGVTIKRAWLDDPTRLTISFDGSLCPSGAGGKIQQSQQQQVDCTNAGAVIVHLKQIRRVNFPNLLSSDSGTLLSLVADGSDGRKLYQFRVIPTEQEAPYTTVMIKPETERKQPLIFTSPAPSAVPQSPSPEAPGTPLNNSAPVIP